MFKPTINLASRSSRRQQLLKQIAVDWIMLDVSIDEIWDQRESAEHYVKRMALEKARMARSTVQNNYPILAADTSVIVDNMILGKPETQQQAQPMLAQLSARSHQVYSAVVLLDGDKTLQRLNISQVRFRQLSESEIIAYCQTDEPLGKAGGYAIQGQAAAFIEHLQGSYSGVMGLPLFEVAEMLRQISDA